MSSPKKEDVTSVEPSVVVVSASTPSKGWCRFQHGCSPAQVAAVVAVDPTSIGIGTIALRTALASWGKVVLDGRCDHSMSGWSCCVFCDPHRVAVETMLKDKTFISRLGVPTTTHRCFSCNHIIRDAPGGVVRIVNADGKLLLEEDGGEDLLADHRSGGLDTTDATRQDDIFKYCKSCLDECVKNGVCDVCLHPMAVDAESQTLVCATKCLSELDGEESAQVLHDYLFDRREKLVGMTPENDTGGSGTLEDNVAYVPPAEDEEGYVTPDDDDDDEEVQPKPTKRVRVSEE